MIQALQQPVSFDKFIDWYPENSDVRYELRNGVIVEMPKAKGKHSGIGGFLVIEAGILIRQFQLPYFIQRSPI
jgi:Uma2 family endonuclease